MKAKVIDFDKYKLNLHLFDDVTNATTSSDLTVEMKTFYNKVLLQNVEPELVHDQFGQKRNIPRNGGKIIEFRKFKQLPKALTPLTEGVTPDGQSMKASNITAEVSQYGGFVRLTDVLQTTTIDNIIVEATQEIASQAGRTLDTVTREELNGGTNVLYAAYNGTRATGRKALTKQHILTVDDVKRAATILKTQNTAKIDGWYVGIINPAVSYDLTNDSKWEDAHKYTDPSNIYYGEIGRIFGVRFAETTEAKVWNAPDLTSEDRELTNKTEISVSTTTVAVKEAISADDATALAGREVYIGGYANKIVSAAAGAAGSASLTVETAISSLAVDAKVVPGEVTATGDAVYSTLVLGANAYGVTELEGLGLEHIVKQLGSGGTADPLNQRSTVGWKATKVAKRLVEEFMVRIESSGTFNELAAN